MSSPGGVSIPLLNQLKTQAPEMQCEITATILNINVMLNRTQPPFDDPRLREAVMLTLDRDAFIDILSDGHAHKGGAMLPAPAGDRKSTRLNSSHYCAHRLPSSA